MMRLGQQQRDMGTTSPAADRPAASHVQHLVRTLTEAAIGAGDGVPADEEVVLDIEVDGFRCVLFRTLSGPEAGGGLSPRELEIARMVALGYPNKTIASVLDISCWTVASHLRRIFTKLGVGSRAAMVARLSAQPRSLGAPTTSESTTMRGV